MTRPDSTPLLSTIHCPTLIVVGEEDTLTPPALSEEMHRAIAGSELIVTQQNFATTSTEALAQEGKAVRLVWRRQHQLPIADGANVEEVRG